MEGSIIADVLVTVENEDDADKLKEFEEAIDDGDFKVTHNGQELQVRWKKNNVRSERKG